MHAEIVSIGNELLNGRKVNSNASFLAASLAGIGMKVARVTSCSDEESEICMVLDESLRRSEFVLVTGGLGPTRDDRTRNAVQKLLERGLVFDTEAYDNLVARMKRLGRQVSSSLHDQAMVVEGSIAIPNTKGTAAGMILSCGEPYENHILVLMPGVPVEMKAMMELTVLPYLEGHTFSVIIHTPVRTAGIGETTLSELIAEVEDSLPEGTTLAYLPHASGVDLIVHTIGTEREWAERDNRNVVDAVLRCAGRFVYATGEVTFEETIGQMLAAAGMTVATAESCTGGLVASRLTDVSGSSAYFIQGFVVYSNRAKESALGVPGDLIVRHGAVSEEVARAMALGCLEKSGADIALSTTGIAGPTGATPDKPVGMICLALAAKSKGIVQSRALYMHGDRALNKLRFSEAALRELWEYLRDMPPRG